MVKIESVILDERDEMRNAFCETLMELAGAHEDIVLLDADLMSAMGTMPFKIRFPHRAIDCGIQEANMVGVAAGLSVAGMIPFAHSFGPFITRRACDQIFVSAAFAELNVKLIGSDPGITAKINGATHMPFEDMGIMRSIPNTVVIEPTDITVLKSVLKQMVASYGVHYMRLVRKECKKIYRDNQEFEIGKAIIHSLGKDVTFIASGYCVANAVEAAQCLKNVGIDAGVIDMFTWKPIDEAAILEACKVSGSLVTCENHNITTGLGAAVSEVVVRNHPCPMEMIGVYDCFGQVGNLDYLAKAYRLTSHDMVEAAQRAVSRKNKHEII